MRSKINKERLLEIAKKNAAKILKTGGDFMGIDEDRLIAMKSGGTSLDELTKFCKELAKKGLEDKDKIDFLAESESESDEEFRHPFMVNDKPLPNPITMLLGAGKHYTPPNLKHDKPFFEYAFFPNQQNLNLYRKIMIKNKNKLFYSRR